MRNKFKNRAADTKFAVAIRHKNGVAIATTIRRSIQIGENYKSEQIH